MSTLPSPEEFAQIERRLDDVERRLRTLEGSSAPASSDMPYVAPSGDRVVIDYEAHVPETGWTGRRMFWVILLSLIGLWLAAEGFDDFRRHSRMGLFELAIAAALAWWIWSIAERARGTARIAAPETMKNAGAEIRASVVIGRIGIVIVLLGLAFLFRAAIDAQLIGPLARVILGILVGAGAIVLGESFVKRYAGWSRMFTGGGLALLYYTLYTAHTPEYGFLGDGPAFALMALVTVVAGALAFRTASPVLAWFALFGGFVTPLLVETAQPNHVFLLAYILLLDGALLALSTRYSWRLLNTVSFFLSYLYVALSIDHLTNTTATLFLVLFFILYRAIPLARSLFRHTKTDAQDLLLVLANPFLSYLLMAEVWRDLPSRGLAGIALAYAAVHGVHAYAVAKRNPADTTLRKILGFIALAFLAAAVFLAFDGLAYVTTILWAVLGVAAFWLGQDRDDAFARLYGTALLALAVLRVLFIDGDPAVVHADPFLNGRFLTYAVVIASLHGAGVLALRRNRSDLSWTFPIIAHALTVWALTLEIADVAETRALSGNVKHVTLSIVYALYGMAVLAAGIARRLRPLRVIALVILAFTVAKILVVDLQALDAFYRVLAYVAVGVLLIIASYSYQRFRWLIIDEA